MQQSADQPCNSLAECRQKVEEIEFELEVTALSVFTASMLKIYMGTILTAIEMLKEQAITGETVQSRDAINADGILRR